LNWTFTVPSSAPLTDGTYSITATATDVAGNVSLSSNPLSIRIDIAIAQPSAPDLVASSDTGQSDTDNITRDNTPTLTGTAEVDSLVTVSDAIGPLGTATAIAGVWTLTPALVLIDGVYSFTVRATDVAGNVSTNSDPLTPVTVDTAITPPVITGVFEDRGPNSGDGITNDTLLVFNGTAEANSTLRFTQVGVGVIAPAVTVTTAGAWSVGGPSGLFFAPGNYSFTAAATDEAGNVSAASATFNLTVDTTSPVNGLAPTLQLADDTGVVGDRITKQHRPRLIGTVADNLGNAIQVQIGDAADTQTLGTATAAIDGSYVVQFNLDLPDGRQTVVTRATDAAGNTALSPSLDFTVDATAPRVTGFSLTGTSPCSGNAKLCTTTSQIVVTFDDLDQALPGDPTFPGSVLNRGNFRLFGASHGTIDLSTSGFVYATADRLTINLAARLPNDTWTFTIDGTGPDSLQDVAGNILDGEASTFSPTSPSGNGVEGGDFIQTFTIAVPLPTVTDNVALSVPAVRLRGTRRVVSGVSIEFTQPLDPRLAVNPALYELRDPGKDGRFDTPDDRTIRLALPTYRPPTATTRATVDLQAIRAFSQNKFFRLTIDGSINPPSDQLALSDLAGNRLDGDGDGNVEPNDDFHALVGRGRKFSYFDGNGDRVGLSLVGGGFMDVVRNGNGEGRSIRLERDVLGQSVVPGRSALVGSVTAISGDGRTKFDLVTGTDGVNLDNFQRPPFVISNPIAAVVVDRLLESGDNVNTLLADSLTDPMRRRS
jgi:hypothetical protein